MKYFNNCKSIEDVKKTYKKLAIKLHPDCNKDHDTTKEFVEMSAEYERAFEQFKNTFVNAEGETYTKENDEMAAAFKDIIDQLLHFEGVTIEIIGDWVWLTGETFKYKEQIKELKFKWANNKKAWYFHHGAYKKKSKRKLTLDELKTMYESTEIKTKAQVKLA